MVQERLSEIIEAFERLGEIYYRKPRQAGNIDRYLKRWLHVECLMLCLKEAIQGYRDDQRELNKRVDAELAKIDKLAIALTNDPYVCRDNRGIGNRAFETNRINEYRSLIVPRDCPRRLIPSINRT
jgi:hypothetical protein